MGLHILLALPVVVVPFRRSLEALEAVLVAMYLRAIAPHCMCNIMEHVQAAGQRSAHRRGSCS